MRLVAALLTGWMLYVVSCWLVPADPTIGGGFEVDWQRMSEAPFDWRGRLPHRVLGPLLAWLTGFGGEGWHDFTQGLHVVMLGSVCFAAMHLGARIGDAVLVTAAIAFTAPVQMYKLHWNAYTDPLCYTLFLWAMVAAKRPFVMWGLFLANLFNHELAGFLLPWLFWLRRRADGRWRMDLVLIAVTCGLYFVYYQYVKSTAAQLFSDDYFLSHPLFPGGSFAVWNLALLHLVTAFGPMLALLAWHQYQDRQTGERWHLWLVGLGVFVIFGIAFDWSRHSNLLMLPLVVASVRFLERGWLHRGLFVLLLGATVVAFWLVPPWSSTAWPTFSISNPTMLVETGMVIAKPGEMNIGFGSLGDALTRWYPVAWPVLVSAYGIAIGLWLIGWWLAKQRHRAAGGAMVPDPAR